MEESVVDHLEKEPIELTQGDKNQESERPDIVDVENESSKEDDNGVLHHKESIHDQLALQAAPIILVPLLLLLLGWQGQDQVVHVEVADAVQDALEHCHALGITEKET